MPSVQKKRRRWQPCEKYTPVFFEYVTNEPDITE